MADREKLWKLVKEAIHSWETDVNMSDHIADHLIANGVTVRERGRWEPRTDAFGFVRCSVCHDCNIYDDWADGKKWSFCPNCGSDMRGEEDA